MRRTHQTVNAQPSRPNAQSGKDAQLDVGCWTLDVGRFLAGMR